MLRKSSLLSKQNSVLFSNCTRVLAGETSSNILNVLGFNTLTMAQRNVIKKCDRFLLLSHHRRQINGRKAIAIFPQFSPTSEEQFLWILIPKSFYQRGGLTISTA